MHNLKKPSESKFQFVSMTVKVLDITPKELKLLSPAGKVCAYPMTVCKCDILFWQSWSQILHELSNPVCICHKATKSLSFSDKHPCPCAPLCHMDQFLVPGTRRGQSRGGPSIQPHNRQLLVISPSPPHSICGPIIVALRTLILI